MRDVHGRNHDAGILRIHHIRTVWDLDMLEVRFEVLGPPFGSSKPGADPKGARVSLVKFDPAGGQCPGADPPIARRFHDCAALHACAPGKGECEYGRWARCPIIQPGL
jgi:hypothetical protein